MSSVSTRFRTLHGLDASLTALFFLCVTVPASQPKTVPAAADGQASVGSVEVGHGVQGLPGEHGQLHEPPTRQHRGVSRRQVQRHARRGAKLGDQIGAVLGGVDGERLGDDEERLGEFGNGKLLATAERGGKVLEVDAESRLDRASTGHDRAALERALDDAQAVVQRTLHLIEQIVVGAAQHDRARADGLGAAHEDELVVADALLRHLVGGTQAARLERLLALEVAEAADELAAGGLGDPAQVLLAAATDGHGACLDKLLETQIVDALGGEDDVGARCEDLAHALEHDLALARADLFQLVGVVDGDVDAEVHALLDEVDVEQGDLGVGDARLHGLGGDGAVEGVAVDEERLARRLAVRLEHVDRLDRILCLAARIDGLDGEHGVDGDLREKVVVGADDLARHAGLCDIDERLLAERVDLGGELVLEVFAGLAAGETVSGDDGGGVDLVLDQLVGATEELGGDDDDRGGAVADLLVLLLCELDEDAACGLVDLEEREDGGAVVGDGDVANVVDEHLVEADGAERRLDDVGDGLGGKHVLVADLCARETLAADEETGVARVLLEELRHGCGCRCAGPVGGGGCRLGCNEQAREQALTSELRWWRWWWCCRG
ncbi:hypothetical protein L1887_62957 [Cichorium endivia]|nr:hypothetical protein L1887_62957 [Cichorium endivia]